MHGLLSIVAGAAIASTANGMLNQIAQEKGKVYFGSATDNGELTDSKYVKILSDNTEFGQLTPANAMKWYQIEPEQGVFDFGPGDVIVDLAEKNGQIMRCHNTVWHSQLAPWVTSDTWTKENLTAAMVNHISNEIGHYKGKCYAWDVVNEALNEDGTYRSDVFYDTIGPDYIPIAFAAAAAADPEAKLYYNDYNIESAGPKSTAAIAMVKSIQAMGIKIDGVGLQSHFVVGGTPSEATQIANMKSFTDLGVDVAITELDIRIVLPGTPADTPQQRADYTSTVCACMAVEGCVGITLWDYTDKYSWIPSWNSSLGLACPWDESLKKKEAYYGIIDGLRHQKCSSAVDGKAADDQ